MEANDQVLDAFLLAVPSVLLHQLEYDIIAFVLDVKPVSVHGYQYTISIALNLSMVSPQLNKFIYSIVGQGKRQNLTLQEI